MAVYMVLVIVSVGMFMGDCLVQMGVAVIFT
jgi:hypothetical protein